MKNQLSFLPLALAVLLGTFSFGIKEIEAQSCSFRVYNIPKCTDIECSKFCVASFGPQIGSHCVAPSSCCCEDPSIPPLCASPNHIPVCNKAECSKFCVAKFGPKTGSNCMGPSSCCCKATKD